MKSVRYSFWLIFLFGLASALASFVLSVEAIHIAEKPDIILSCDINSSISCGTVSRHETAQILGFPNSFIGMLAEPVFITLSVVMLAGATLSRWLLRAAFAGMTISLAFALWMFYTSSFVIGALCPWCLVVTFSSIIMWFAMLRFMVLNQLCLSKKATEMTSSLFVQSYDKMAMWLTIVAIIAIIIVKYGNSLFL